MHHSRMGNAYREKKASDYSKNWFWENEEMLRTIIIAAVSVKIRIVVYIFFNKIRQSNFFFLGRIFL